MEQTFPYLEGDGRVQLENASGTLINPATEETLAEIASTVITGTSESTDTSINIQGKESDAWAWSFADEVASGVDATQGTVIQTGAGMAVSQANGNLLITTGTTAYSETIIRANQTLKGRFRFEYALALSQRIANNNFAIELVEIIGDGLVCENTTSTRLIVTIPSHTYTAADIGKTIYVCAITGMSALPQAATINQITDANRIRLAVTAFPGLGAFGTCTLYGWNSHTIVYNGTSATALGGGYGTTRKGRPTANVSGSINTTASGHMGILEAFKPFDSTYLDQVLGTGTGTQPSSRVMVNQNLPPDDANLTVQIRVWNGSTAPATTTTTTFGFLRYERVNPLNVAVAGVQALSAKNPMPVNVNNTISANQGSAVALGTTGTGAWTVRGGAVRIADIASAAITTTATSASISLVDIVGSHQFTVDTTAVTGTNANMRARIQASGDGGTNFPFNIYDFPRTVNATDKTFMSPVMPVEFANIRYVRTVAPTTTPSITNSVTRTVRAGGEAKRLRQLNDLVISLTATAGTGSTEYLYVEGCTRAQMVCDTLTSITTAPVLKLQMCSSDPTITANWIDVPSATLTTSDTVPTASSVFDIGGAKFLRFAISTAGSGATTALYNLFIKSWE